VSSSRVPAGGVSSKVPGKEALWGQGTKREGGEGKIASRLATTDKRAIPGAFGRTTRPGGDRDVTNQGFPHQRYKPSKPRPTLTASPTP